MEKMKPPLLRQYNYSHVFAFRVGRSDQLSRMQITHTTHDYSSNESTAGADASVEALKLYHMLSLLALALKLYHMLSLLPLLARALVARIVQKMGNDQP